MNTCVSPRTHKLNPDVFLNNGRLRKPTMQELHSGSNRAGLRAATRHQVFGADLPFQGASATVTFFAGFFTFALLAGFCAFGAGADFAGFGAASTRGAAAFALAGALVLAALLA